MFATQSEFEDEVRRIGRLLWPGGEFGGAAIIDRRERDAVFETEEFVHCVECTVSRSKEKAREDIDKLARLIRKLGPKHPTKFIKGWFVTLQEPTADQRSVLQKYQGRIVAVSFDQFRSRLIDSRSYLTQRKDYPFGSVRDPETGKALASIEYVPLQMLSSDATEYGVTEVSEIVLNGRQVVLLGDYGAGKSATVRELFHSLARRFWANETNRFPVALNLRDHHGQTDPVEALERHARNVGFSQPSALVRAWRAGLTLLLLDGFDEIASAGWAGKTKKLRDLRYRSMELIRHFLSQSPNGTGILLTGRAHFFDSDRELGDALSVRSQATILSIREFTTTQVAAYLEKLGWSGAVPEWLPSRPLLVAYLAHTGLLKTALEGDTSASPALGWDSLLDRIATREAEIEAGIDPGTVRRLIERLATMARGSSDGLGPLSPDEIIEAFRQVCGYTPDDRGAVLLQRLPGLGAHNPEDGSRVFIDRDFVEAARGSAIYRFIEDPYHSQLTPETWQTTLEPLGADLAAYKCTSTGFTAGKIEAAIEVAAGMSRAATLAADLLLIAKEFCSGYSGPRLYIKEVFIPELALDEESCDLHNAEFQDSIVALLDLPPDVTPAATPSFVRTHFALVIGRTGSRDLPSERFQECTFDEFEASARTTNAILALPLPLSTRVILTLLKKLYAQSGAGRRESALYRGLDLRAKQLVPDALDLLRKTGFAVRSRQRDQTVWLPSRTGDSRRRALAMLAAPSASQDPLLEASRQIG